MVLAVLGTVAWFFVGLAGVLTDHVFDAVIGLGLGGLSVVEIVRWQRGQPALAISNRPRAARGDLAVPTPWFGLGGLSAAFLLGIVWVVVDPDGALHSRTGTPSLAAIAVYLVFGGLTAWVLSRSYDRREHTAAGSRTDRPSIPPAPPPPRGSVDAHNATPVHDLGGPTATLHHLRSEHGVELDPFTSNDVVIATHADLHAETPSI
jgi:hypothetical protein